jgi:2,5-diamino-6-(ribosylamino)-4(3H)-pyrimidinone 5'-phosphate reductase
MAQHSFPYPADDPTLHAASVVGGDQERPEIFALSDDKRAELEPYLPPNRATFLMEGNAGSAAGRAHDYVPVSPSEGYSSPRIEWTGPKKTTIPHVTLTYAQSLDGQIALNPGVRTTISGEETKAMTQYLRSRHDAILIGKGTANADNPGLNTKYSDDGQFPVGLDRQPRPIILDPSKQWREDLCEKLFNLARQRLGRPPWVVNSYHSTDGGFQTPRQEHVDEDRVFRLREVGGETIKAGDHFPREDGVDWQWILSALGATGIRSIMIEGGATVINDLLRLRNQQWIDSLIVTIAPTYLGEGGVHVLPLRNQMDHKALELSNVKWLHYGNDIVMAWKGSRSVTDGDSGSSGQSSILSETLNRQNNPENLDGANDGTRK